MNFGETYPKIRSNEFLDFESGLRWIFGRVMSCQKTHPKGRIDKLRDVRGG